MFANVTEEMRQHAEAPSGPTLHAAPVKVPVDMREDGRTLMFDPATGDLTLRDATVDLAALPDAADQVRTFATSRIPSALHLPSAGLDLGWSLVFFPSDGTLLVHNPFGETVGGLRREHGFAFINALRTALGINLG